MSAPLFLTDPGMLDAVRPGDTYRLSGPEGRHAGTVKRVRRGEMVDLADGAGVRARCRVDGVANGDVDLVIEHVSTEQAPPVALVLAQALAKGDRDELAIATATELGVDEIVPWQAERSVVVWRGERAAKSFWRWQATVREAAKQSRRAKVPHVHPPVDSRGLAAHVAQVVAEGGVAVVLHEDGELRLDDVRLPVAGQVLIAVGPEGGIGENEVGVLAAAGAQVVRLGDNVMRTSTAGPAALAALSLLTGRWSAVREPV